MNLIIDIETIPAQRSDVLEEITASMQTELIAAIAAIKPPGNYKKQETIDEWMATEAPKQAAALREAFAADVDAAYRKTSLDGAYGQICVIGAAFGDDAPILSWRQDFTDERQILEDFGCVMVDQIPRHDDFTTQIVGHNVAAFDLRFLLQRHIVNGVIPHMVIARAARAKPWESEKVYDTMVQWAGVGNRIKLDKLCKALSIPTPKGDIDGSKVWDFVKDGQIEQVAAYCARDVEATRAAYKRMTFQD